MSPGSAAILSAIRRPSSTRTKVLGALAMLVALCAWALATPVGGSPDEDYHLGSIWCAHGFEPGVCQPAPTGNLRLVPEELVRADCYRFVNVTSASCQTSLLTGAGLAEIRGNWIDHSYPPVYYWFQGFFVGDDVESSVLVMRLVNILIYLGLVAGIYALLPTGLRRSIVGGALITTVPLGLFLVSSVNPSGWAMLSATTLLVSLLGYLTATDLRRRVGLGALAALSLLIGAGARADAATYAALAVVVAVIFTFQLRPDRRALARLALPAILVVAAAVAFLSSGQSKAVTGGLAASPGPVSLSGFLDTVLEVPSLWAGAFGGWPLGWIDAVMPGIVWVGSWATFAAVLFVAVTGNGLRSRLAVGLIFLAVLAVPTQVLVSAGVPVGVGVQPRYLLPLIVMLAVAAMVRLEGPAFRLTGGQRWIVVTILAIANAVALHANIKRYTVGIDGTSWNLNRQIEWWWHLPISPMAVWFLGGIAFGAGLVLLTRDLATAGPAIEPVAESTVEPSVEAPTATRAERLTVTPA